MIFTPEIISDCHRIMRIVATNYRVPGVEVDDLISCAWLRVCIRIERFDERKASFPTFVSRQARYAMQDYLRALAPKMRSQIHSHARFVPLPESLEALASHDLHNRIDVALLLMRLNAQERRVIRMRFWEERQLKEIGRLHGYGEAWAWVRIREALEKMAA